jgi:secondary thiamine-phosphate synthase enzyme
LRSKIAPRTQGKITARDQRVTAWQSCAACAKHAIMHHTITINTHGPGLYEFTQQLTHLPLTGALLSLFIRHTSASLLIQENADSDVRADLADWLHRTIPPSNHPDQSWMRHTAEGPDDMPAHIKSAILPVSLSIPIIDGTLALGTWQGVYLVEHRTAPHTRKIIATIT